MLKRHFSVVRRVMGRLERGDDLLGQLTALAQQEGVETGTISFFGALEHAHLAYYDQAAQTYVDREQEGPLELTSGLANVSLRDGQPFVHAHVTVADSSGQVWGGHLLEGSRLFACEFVLEIWDGEPWERTLDGVTGLWLWHQG